jgi:hypothetical protein
MLPDPNHQALGPIAADNTPFARLRNGLHKFILAGGAIVDADAQEIARAIGEALPGALQLWPDRERLLPLQQLQDHLSELRYHSDWPKTLRLIRAVRELLPDLVSRAHIAKVEVQEPKGKPVTSERRGAEKKRNRLDELRQLLLTAEWRDAKRQVLATKLGVSERTLRSYLDGLRKTGK